MSIARTRRVLLAAALAAVSALTAPGLAQDAENWENLVIPQHRVVLPPIRESSVRIETVEVDVRITEQVATTTVGIVLRNPAGRAQESQLLMPVPDGAVVRQFRLEGLPDEGIAKVLTREEARRIYESIVRRTRDPGLIEFVGLNLIKSSVFPVPANGTQRMELVYEQVLPADGSRVDYVLPRSESLERSGVKWSMKATIRSSRAIGTVYSPSHDLATERLGDGSVRVTVPESSANDPGSFRLSYVMAASDGLAASLIAYPDPRVGSSGHGGYFMLLLGVPAEAERPVIKREITLVIDRSGSMRGEKIEQAKNAALQIVGALDDGEFFNIIDYSDTIESFAAAPVAKTADTLRKAEEYIEGLAAVGGTNIHDALLLALQAEPAAGTLPMVLFLTDGLATVGVRSERDIREAARKANQHGRRIFSFGVGFDVNSPLLSALATNSRGAPTFVMPDEDIEVKVGQVFKRLQGPVLAGPQLTFAGRRDARVAREILPGALGDIFEGEQVVVLGQYLDSTRPFEASLVGERFGSGDAKFEMTFDLSKATVQHSYVPRIWAMRKIGTLIDEIRQSGADGSQPNKELVDEVIRLSTEFGILTEYTAFLAAEENEFLGQIRGMPAANMPAAELQARMRREVGEGGGRRSGGGSVSQDANARRQLEADKLSRDNRLLYSLSAGEPGDPEQMQEARFVSVLQNADQTLYRRGTRWVDAQLLDQAEEEPERTIEFASDEYFELANRLAKENRQSVLAVAGDIYLLLDGKRTLIRQTP